MSSSTPMASPSPLPLPLPLPILSSSALNPQRGAWTNLCIYTLLDEYEKVFAKLGRGHLRLKDWETVAFEVNRHTHGCRTPEQCKGKIKSLKKHYRRERLKCSAPPCRPSRWIFFNKVRQVVRDPLPQVCALGVGAVADGCNVNEKKALAGSEDGATKAWGMDRMEFEKKPCGGMGLGNTEFEVKTTGGFDGRQSMGKELEGEESGDGGVGPAFERTVNGQPARDNLKSGMVNTPVATLKKMPVTASAEAVDPPEPHVEKAARKSSTKNRELASLGRDLKEGLSSFAAVIEKIERTKMELTVLLQRQRLEQDRHHAEMQAERTRLLMRSQLDLAELICASSWKGCQRCSKKGRWDDVFDVTSCRDKEDKEEGIEDEQGDKHEIRVLNNRCTESKLPFPGFREGKLQVEDREYRGNGYLFGGQNSKGNESTTEGTESFKEDQSEEDEIRQEDQNNLTHWDRGMGLLQKRDLNLSIDSNFNTEAGQERGQA